MVLPPQIPVMVLPSCSLLPFGLLPLRLFEPRYRQMLSDCLEDGRMFAIGTIAPDSDMASEQPEVLDYSCAGLIRACVHAPDGTANLILQGLRRIRFTGWVDNQKPYRTALIEPIPTTDNYPQISAPLARKALELARDLIADGLPHSAASAIEEIDSINNPEVLADVIAYRLIQDPHQRHPLLEIEDLRDRLRFVIAQMADIGPNLP